MASILNKSWRDSIVYNDIGVVSSPPVIDIPLTLVGSTNAALNLFGLSIPTYK